MTKTPDFPMPITTSRLIIRPPKIEDAKMLTDAVTESFDEVHRYMDWATEKQTLEKSEDFIKLAITNWIEKKNDEPYLPLFIFEKDSLELIGVAGFHHYNWHIPSIQTGYWIRTSFSGKGYMTEAIHAHTVYAFKQLNVNRISISCNADNTKSKNIPERLHYTLEGKLKNHRRRPDNNALGDTLIYARYDLTDMPELAVSWTES